MYVWRIAKCSLDSNTIDEKKLIEKYKHTIGIMPFLNQSQAYAKTGVIYRELRLLVNRLLQEKLEQPNKDLKGELSHHYLDKTTKTS